MMKRTLRHNRIAFICILSAFLLSLIWAFTAPSGQELSVEMYYHNAPEDIRSQLFWAENGVFSAQHCTDGSREGNIVLFALPQTPQELTAVRIDPSNTEAPYGIARIAFRLNGENFFILSQSSLLEKLVPVNAALSLSDDTLLVTPQNADSGLLLSEEALHESAVSAASRLRRLVLLQRFSSLLVLAVCLMLLVCFAQPIRRYFIALFTRDESGHFDWFSFLSTGVMAGAFLAVCAIGLFSDLGLHPDEWDVKACLEYGMTHFFPPDMRDPEVAGTYSGYGYTKLENYTWYFFLAGKVALLFQKLFYALPWWRMPNLLLFAAMAFFFVRNIRRHNWLMVSFGICAQAWYIFSYTTADALDFVWSFCILYELAEENSLLNRSLRAPGSISGSLPGLLPAGVLFGMIFLGKQNYWSIPAFAFVLFLSRLLGEKEKDRRLRLLQKYGCILAVVAAVILCRAGFDLAHYGLQKSEVKYEMAVQHSDYDKNPATPPAEQAPSYHMYAKGASLSDFFAENPEWLSMSYKSFCGLIQDNDTGLWYYLAMGIVYAVLMVSIGIWVFRNAPLQEKWIYVCGILLMAGSLAASIVNSYVIDSQAQGRYLLPALLLAGFLASRAPKLLQKPGIRALLCAGGLLSMFYFCLVGVPLFL